MPPDALVTRRSATTSQARCGYTPVSHMTGRRVRMLPWDPLWRLRHVGYPRVASRLPGTTRLRFALHGGQRLKVRRFQLSFQSVTMPNKASSSFSGASVCRGSPSTTNTTRSTSPGWPFSLPKALYSRGFLRKAADFESQPATLSHPGFLSDSAIPLCFERVNMRRSRKSATYPAPGTPAPGPAHL